MHSTPSSPAAILAAAVIPLLLASATPAFALPRRSSVASGAVQANHQDVRSGLSRCCVGTILSNNTAARTLHIARQGGAGPLTLVWNSRSLFVKGTRTVTAAELTKGTPVTVWYRTPFLGERYATKIITERTARSSP
jgi:hypothetical protein